MAQQKKAHSGAVEQRIRPLPELVRNQIAAGEVVERPASIVKELLENSLDAGSTRVHLELEEGGTKLVRVTDDGCGLSPLDLELAFMAHATSKLSDAADLDHIATLGFRGEALASIASVARCRICSRQPERETGFEIECQGGDLGDVREAGAAQGTVIEVRDLFYNTPARRRFLKRPSTEMSHCLDVVQRLALAQEGVGFVVSHNGKRVLDIEPDMDLRGRVRRTFGAELAESLVEVEGEVAASGTDPGVRLWGFVAPPRFSRRDTARQMWFLNGRPLRDKLLTKCLKEGFRGFLVENRQPVAFLALSLDPSRVDVNVHPQKTEVRFHDGRKLFGFAVNAIRAAVAKTDMSTPGEKLLGSLERRGEWSAADSGSFLPDPGPAGSSESGGSRPSTLYPRSPGSNPGSSSGGYGRTAFPGGSGGGASTRQDWSVREVPNADRSSGFSGSLSPSEAVSSGGDGSAASNLVPSENSGEHWQAGDDFRGPFLQVDKTYLVRALDDGFEIVDQHALHERLTYEGLLSEVRAGKVEVQSMLVPELVEVSRAQVSLLENHLEGLRSLGIHLEPFGETTMAVHGLPARLRRPDVEGVVRDLLDTIERTGSAPEAADVLEEVLHRTACRSSIMAGDALTEDEIRSLLVRARQLETDQTCPHARPTRVRFTLHDLEKAFHRR